MTGAPSQFGVYPAGPLPGPDLLNSEDGGHAAGFHVFSASNAKDEAALITEFAANINTVSAAVARAGFEAQLVDIGGGFGAPYAAPGSPPEYPHLRAALSYHLDEGLPGWRAAEPRERVMVESGRYLVAAAGTLLTTVMDIKENGGNRYLLCDAGINALGGMHGLGRLVNPKAQPENQSSDSGPVVLAGPLCTPLDILSRSARIDRPTIGGVLAIPNVGAYGLTASLVTFLAGPLRLKSWWTVPRSLLLAVSASSSSPSEPNTAYGLEKMTVRPWDAKFDHLLRSYCPPQGFEGPNRPRRRSPGSCGYLTNTEGSRSTNRPWPTCTAPARNFSPSSLTSGYPATKAGSTGSISTTSASRCGCLARGTRPCAGGPGR